MGAPPSTTSTQSVITTLVANLLLFGIFFTFFILLRIKFKRIYSPRSSFEIAPEDKRPPELPKDPFSWMYVLATKPHSFYIQHTGLDGYFFLRYLFIFGCIFLGGVLTYIVLFPVNAVGGNGNVGLDQLSIANVADRNRYYAHVFVSWVYYGATIFVIYRELFLFNSLRCAALSSPKYAKKLSSRTVLFQSVPDNLLDEKQFFKLYNGVKRIYVSRTVRSLTAKLRERDNLVSTLEKAEHKLLSKAYKTKLKADKKGITIEPADDINAYVPENKRPKMKVNGVFGGKTDTIKYCLEEIPKVDNEVRKLQKRFRTGKPKNSLFVEFDNQYMAQLALQSTVHHNPFRMEAVATGVEPDDIIWSNLRLFWWEKIVRRMFAAGIMVAIILLWAIPVAFVGVISNISYLIDTFPWLEWITNLPDQLYGLITGLLPTIMIIFLMSLLPIFIRAMGTIAGYATTQAVEMFAQNVFFGFLVVNVFLITTLASSATSTVGRIVDEPTSAMQLLAEGLPKSSNFFISFIIFQGLLISGGALFQIVGLILYYALGKLLDNTVTKKWNRFTGLAPMLWGTTFPVYSNLASITMAYSIISPIILIFASFAFFLIFVVFGYALTYVFVEGPDNRGLHYPRALFQTFTGIYLGQVCLLGIFAVGKGWGPIVLEAIGIGFTVLCHLTLKQAFDRLVQEVPIDVMKPLDGVSETPSFTGTTDYKHKVLDRKRHHDDDLQEVVHEEQQLNDQIKQDLLHPDINMNKHQDEESLVPLMADRDFKKLESTNPLVKFIRPDVFLNFRHAKQLLPATYNVEAEWVDDKHAYDVPMISSRLPTIWIPKDPMGLSTVEIENAKGSIHMSDENSSYNEKGDFIYLGPPPE